MAPDPETLSRAARGDRAAFDEIYARYGRGVFVFLAGLLRSREDAEDALQATLLRAWVWLPRLRRRDRFTAWLFRIARNVANDSARLRLRWPRMIEAQDDLLGPAPEVSHGEDGLRRLVAGLKPETRALVLLRAVEGWNAEDAGAAMGMSAATARRRYAKALKQLRLRLERSERP